jgi:tetratricopeptide (TPR) repeat protein
MFLHKCVPFASLGLCGILLLASCQSSRRASESPLPERSDSLRQSFNRDRALDHFIKGTLYDAKGEYASAILEYQDALRYDQDPAIYYAISKDYSLIGKHALAAQTATEAIRRDSINITYRENLAGIYLAAFEQERALKVYQEIVRLDSTNTRAWYALARLYQASRPLQALQIYEKLMDREGESWDLLLQTAELYSTLGRWNEAADRFRQLLTLDPSNRALQRQLAETYAHAGNLDSAATILESMVEVNDKDPDVLAALADVYLERREFPKAMALYERLLKEQGQNPEIKLRVGIAYFGQIPSDSSFIPRAREVFNEVAEQVPGDWRPFWYLGAIASGSGQDSVAAGYFERVTQLEQRNLEAWLFLGSYHFEHQQYEETIRLMDRARTIFPDEERIYVLLGVSYSQTGDRDLAIENLERAVRLNPKDVNALSSLALTYDGMRKYERSDSLYEEALRVDPDAAIVLNNYGYSLAERGLQLQRALDMALRAVKAEPENSAYLDTLGWVYFKLGDYAEAERYIAQAVAAGGASAVVHEHLGDVYAGLGQKQKAVEYWQKALKMGGNAATLKDKIHGESEP